MLNAGQVLSREQLLDHVWGLDFDPGSNVVDVYVGYLRKKFGADTIATVRGHGLPLQSAEHGVDRARRRLGSRSGRIQPDQSPVTATRLADAASTNGRCSATTTCTIHGACDWTASRDVRRPEAAVEERTGGSGRTLHGQTPRDVWRRERSDLRPMKSIDPQRNPAPRSQVVDAEVAGLARLARHVGLTLRRRCSRRQRPSGSGTAPSRSRHDAVEVRSLDARRRPDHPRQGRLPRPHVDHRPAGVSARPSADSGVEGPLPTSRRDHCPVGVSSPGASRIVWSLIGETEATQRAQARSSRRSDMGR